MIDTFVITLREGVEAALVIAIAVAYVKRIGRPDLLPAVYRALLTAVAASFIGAWGLAKIGWNPDAYEGWVLLLSAFFVGTMVVWMNRHGKHIKTEIETGLQKGRGAWGVFWFVFLMIFREGVETVAMLAALGLNTSGVMSAVGAVLGIVLAVLFGVSFVRGTIRVNLKQFFRVTTVILMVVVAQLTITGLHELSESQVLPSSSREMAVIGPVVKNDVFFFITVLALVAAMVLFESRARRGPKAEELEGAAKRKAEWTARRERFWMVTSCLASCVFIMLITAEFVYARAQTALSTPKVVAFENGAVRIAAADVSDGNLHRFVVADGGSQVRFIIIEKPDKSLATAYDACEICGTQGYYQKGSEVICRNCASDIVISSIGSHGGCNPIPLESRMEGGMVVINEPAFERGIKMFHDQ
ncbi:MAG TPA: Fe-S-containing protein [Bryobacteraceae bacterium]|jgi:FTR1 family protein